MNIKSNSKICCCTLINLNPDTLLQFRSLIIQKFKKDYQINFNKNKKYIDLSHNNISDENISVSLSFKEMDFRKFDKIIQDVKKRPELLEDLQFKQIYNDIIKFKKIHNDSVVLFKLELKTKKDMNDSQMKDCFSKLGELEFSKMIEKTLPNEYLITICNMFCFDNTIYRIETKPFIESSSINLSTGVQDKIGYIKASKLELEIKKSPFGVQKIGFLSTDNRVIMDIKMEFKEKYLSKIDEYVGLSIDIIDNFIKEAN